MSTMDIPIALDNVLHFGTGISAMIVSAMIIIPILFIVLYLCSRNRSLQNMQVLNIVIFTELIPAGILVGLGWLNIMVFVAMILIIVIQFAYHTANRLTGGS